MNALVDAAVNRTRTTLLLMLMVIIAGIFSLKAISVEGDPYIQVPFKSFFLMRVSHLRMLSGFS